MSRKLVATIPVYETSIDEVFYPEAEVFLGDLNGPGGNAFSIMGKAAKALRAVGADPAEYLAAARGGGYDHLLFVTRSYMRVLESGEGRTRDA